MIPRIANIPVVPMGKTPNAVVLDAKTGAVVGHANMGLAGRVVRSHEEVRDGRTVTVIDEIEPTGVGIGPAT